MSEQRQLVFVLHAHLPFLRHAEGTGEVEERWLFEAILESYLPLVDMFLRLFSEGIGARISFSISPTLLWMLRDPLLLARFERHMKRLDALIAREQQRAEADAELRQVVELYRRKLDRAQQLWWAIAGDLPSALAALEQAGVVELMTSAATHAYLPLLQPKALRRLQIELALEQHELVFHRRPRAFWLPECGYEPGLEELLAGAGVSTFFVEAQAGGGAAWALPAGVSALARDPECSTRIWSATEGYPADPDYREFYRDIVSERSAQELGELAAPPGVWLPTGLKYARVTGATEAKKLYRPARAMGRARLHARDFIARLGARSASSETVVVAPFDAELFGHWWFEGPEFLEEVIRLAAADERLSLATASEPRLRRFSSPTGGLPSSSWGDGGDNRFWMSAKNGWMQTRINRCGQRALRLLRGRSAEPFGLSRRAWNASLRHLLVAQASDWPFLVEAGTSSDYAENRFRAHLSTAESMLAQIEVGLVDEDLLRRSEQSLSFLSGVDMYSSLISSLSSHGFHRCRGGVGRW